MTSAIPAVRFRGVARHFGTVRAVDGVDLDIAPGEFFAMLGPSGSGKTTCLRLIAGFEQPTAGHIEIFGEAVEGVPAYRRPVNTVFQDYALFPHMNVLGERLLRAHDPQGRQGEREKLGREALAMVKLGAMEARKPGELSGGQRQRVALARALVVKPKVLLLDEPLGALDLKLREEMQGELKSLQRSLGLSFVFVTHDQGEALSMADRVAVFNEGRIVQVGSPEEIYERPRTRFVADFVGGSNVIEPAVVSAWTGTAKPASLRAEKITVLADGAPAADGAIVVEGLVTQALYQGAVKRVELAMLNGGRLVAAVPAGANVSAGAGHARARRLLAQRPSISWRTHERRLRPASREPATASCGASRTCSSRGKGLLLLLLLIPPLLWLGVVYLGSLFALLAQSFFSIDEFSGTIVREPTLKTYGELLQPANLDIILRTVLIAAMVTVLAAIIAFPIAYYAARYARGRTKALFYLAVMMPLWSSYLVKVYAWKLLLAKEGAVGWAMSAAGASPLLDAVLGTAGDRRAVAVGQLSRHGARVPLSLDPVHGAAGPGVARAGAGDAHRGLERSRRDARPDLPHRHPAARLARRDRGLDLHVLAHARRLHRAADHRAVVADPGPGRLCAAGARRQHSARGRVLGRADRDHGHLPHDREEDGGVRCALIFRARRSA